MNVVTAMTRPGDLELASTAEYRAVRSPPDTPTRARNTQTPAKSLTATQAALPAMATKIEANATGRQRQRRCSTCQFDRGDGAEPSRRPVQLRPAIEHRRRDEGANRADDEQRIDIGESRERVEPRSFRWYDAHPKSIGVRVSSSGPASVTMRFCSKPAVPTPGCVRKISAAITMPASSGTS